jgi:hypothetical protein
MSGIPVELASKAEFIRALSSAIIISSEYIGGSRSNFLWWSFFFILCPVSVPFYPGVADASRRSTRLRMNSGSSTKWDGAVLPLEVVQTPLSALLCGPRVYF